MGVLHAYRHMHSRQSARGRQQQVSVYQAAGCGTLGPSLCKQAAQLHSVVSWRHDAITRRRQHEVSPDCLSEPQAAQAPAQPTWRQVTQAHRHNHSAHPGMLTGNKKKSLVSCPLRKKLGRYFMALWRNTDMF